MTRTPLTSRPLDLVYFIFFLTHVPASLLVDFQYLYAISLPSGLIPEAIRKLPEHYVGMSNDPLIGGLLGHFGSNDHLIWLKSFLFLEAVFQFPVFILGMRGLWKGSRSIYILLLIYGASTATTTLPCVASILATPLTTAEAAMKGVASITSEQRTMLLASYVPYFVLPLIMTLDMASRVYSLVQSGIKAERAAKTR